LCLQQQQLVVHAKQVTPVLRQQVVRFVRQENTRTLEPQLALIAMQTLTAQHWALLPAAIVLLALKHPPVVQEQQLALVQRPPMPLGFLQATLVNVMQTTILPKAQELLDQVALNALRALKRRRVVLGLLLAVVQPLPMELGIQITYALVIVVITHPMAQAMQDQVGTNVQLVPVAAIVALVILNATV